MRIYPYTHIFWTKRGKVFQSPVYLNRVLLLKVSTQIYLVPFGYSLLKTFFDNSTSSIIVTLTRTDLTEVILMLRFL